MKHLVLFLAVVFMLPFLAAGFLSDMAREGFKSGTALSAECARWCGEVLK